MNKSPAPPTQAIQLIAALFGGKLDAFFGYVTKQRHGYRGATPSFAQRRADRKSVADMKIKPFHKRPMYLGPKPPSLRDQHRACAHRQALPGRPIEGAFA